MTPARCSLRVPACVRAGVCPRRSGPKRVGIVAGWHCASSSRTTASSCGRASSSFSPASPTSRSSARTPTPVAARGDRGRAAGCRADGHPDATVVERRGDPRRRAAAGDATLTVGVVVLSQYAEPVYALALLESGSDGRGIPAQGARARPGAAPVRDRDRWRRRLGHGRGASWTPSSRQDARRALAAGRAALRASARCSREIAQGKSNGAIADSLVLTKRAVEKHINSIFSKLDLSEAESASKRVKAALAFLAGRGATRAENRSAPSGSVRTRTRSDVCTTTQVRCVRPCRRWARSAELIVRSAGLRAADRTNRTSEVGWRT